MSEHPIRRAVPWLEHRSWEWTASVAFLGLLGLAALSATLQEGSPGSSFGLWLSATRQVVVEVTLVVVTALPAGAALGVLAVLGPGVFSALLNRAVELAGALPSLVVLGLWRVGAEDPTWTSFVSILILLKSIETARLVAERTRRARERGYVQAARALGSSTGRIFRVHLLPRLFPALGVSAGTVAVYVVGLEAASSFVGLGPTDATTWGSLLGRAADRGDVDTGLVWACLSSIVLSTLALYAVCRPRALEREH